MIRWALTLAVATAAPVWAGGDDPATARRGGSAARRPAKAMPPTDPPEPVRLDAADDDAPPAAAGPAPDFPLWSHPESTRSARRPTLPGVRRHVLLCVWRE